MSQSVGLGKLTSSSSSPIAAAAAQQSSSNSSSPSIYQQPPPPRTAINGGGGGATEAGAGASGATTVRVLGAHQDPVEPERRSGEARVTYLTEFELSQPNSSSSNSNSNSNSNSSNGNYEYLRQGRVAALKGGERQQLLHQRQPVGRRRSEDEMSGSELVRGGGGGEIGTKCPWFGTYSMFDILEKFVQSSFFLFFRQQQPVPSARPSPDAAGRGGSI